MGTDVHGLLARDGLLLPPCRDIALGNALVYLYAKTGKLASVEDLLFDALAVCRDAITWNTAILGYAHGDDGEEDARRCFVQMQCEGFYADAVALSCIVKSCGSIANGHRLHTAVVADEQPAKESVIANALVDMYTRCGSVAEAQAVFKLMLAAPDAGSWNVLIASYAQSGDHYLASRMFSKMIARGKLPDVVTFAHLLSACNHSGESEKAHAYLHAMIASYGLIPMSEHYACLIDLLARSGRLDDATELIERLPLAIGLSAWHSLQSACRRRPGDSSRWALLGRYAFDHAIQLDEASSAAYRLYEQNLFASSGSEVS
jgi:pentatricopeptide repeat protein